MKPTYTQHNSARGFSTLELLLVVVILFVISAITLPRFVRSADNSHIEKVEETAASFRAAVSEVHALWLSDGGEGSVRNLQNYLNGQIDTNSRGYPTGIHDRDQITHAADCAHAWLNLVSNPPSVWHNERLDPDYVAELSNGECRYRYRRASGISIVYQPLSGQIIIDAHKS